MDKIDYKKELKHLYKSSAKKVEIVEVPRMNFLMINGEGAPMHIGPFSEEGPTVEKVNSFIEDD